MADYYIRYDAESVVWAFEEDGVEWFVLKDIRAVLDAQMPIAFNADTIKRVDATTYVNNVGIERMVDALEESGRDVGFFRHWFSEIQTDTSVTH